MKQFISKGEQDTIEFANRFATVLKKGDLIWLSGDLGSGKTKFTQGILKHFDLEDQISSPTFTIVNEYIKEPIQIYHFDVYRIEDEEEFYAMGGEEYFDKGICLIEWGERIQSILPKPYLKISFQKTERDLDERILKIEAVGEVREEIKLFLEEECHEDISH